MVMGMLRKAVKKCGNAATPMLHSDQCWPYRMQPYRAALARYGMKQSMSRKGNCFDNAAMESFFGTLKADYFHLTDFEDVDALRAGLKGYIDYYNRHRIKSKPGGLSPVEYRMRAGKISASTSNSRGQFTLAEVHMAPIEPAIQGFRRPRQRAVAVRSAASPSIVACRVETGTETFCIGYDATAGYKNKCVRWSTTHRLRCRRSPQTRGLMLDGPADSNAQQRL